MDKPDISKVKVGDKVYGRWEKRAYTVMARNERYVIISKPFNPKKTAQYSIIDLQEWFMWPDNYIMWMYDYLDNKSCDKAIADLWKWGMQISKRRWIALIDFDKIIHI